MKAWKTAPVASFCRREMLQRAEVMLFVLFFSQRAHELIQALDLFPVLHKNKFSSGGHIT
jgi:hypothetical protein